ncbi:hypothetical protein [Streptomyces sp. NPDC017435]|uniref:hypothetical protein n=1 Tax=Streptomyces sp. NPDC017435 TaxID=3364995 RepID=UPI003794101D
MRTADPAARATVTDAELTGAPGDTVLRLGTIDAAYDARGRSLADVSGYLTRRFGLPGGDAHEVRRQLLRRRPPACLVVGGVDRARDPEALVQDLLGQLAARARSRGVRLVLGFEGVPPAGRPAGALLGVLAGLAPSGPVLTRCADRLARAAAPPGGRVREVPARPR